MTKIEITEDRPLSYTCHDGTVIVVSVAGPVEPVYTLTVGGERIDSSASEAWIRFQARGHAESHNARAARPDASVPEIDGYTPEPVDLDELRAELTATQMTSPLVEGERQFSGLAGGGAAANAMSAPVRDMLATAARHPQGEIWRGGGRGAFRLPMLRAAARRGWLALNHPIRPAYATITDAGRRALAAEIARTGGAR